MSSDPGAARAGAQHGHYKRDALDLNPLLIIRRYLLRLYHHERMTGIEPAFSPWKGETLAIMLHPQEGGTGNRERSTWEGFHGSPSARPGSSPRPSGNVAGYAGCASSGLLRGYSPGRTEDLPGFNGTLMPTELSSRPDAGTRTPSTWTQTRRADPYATSGRAGERSATETYQGHSPPGRIRTRDSPLVGDTGFEPMTSASRTQRSTKLS